MSDNNAISVRPFDIDTSGIDDFDEYEEFEKLHGDEFEGDMVLREIGAEPIDPNALSLQELEFARELAKRGKYIQAYKQVFDTSNMSYNVMTKMASRLANRPKIQRHVAELRAEAALVSKMDINSLTAMAHESFVVAKEERDAKGMVVGVRLISDLLGIGENQKIKNGEQRVLLTLDDDAAKLLRREIALEVNREEKSNILDLDSNEYDITPSEI